MSRTALTAVLLLAAMACSPSGATDTTTGAGQDYPLTVESDSGLVTIVERPMAIVSLSPTATEMLFAIGAGDQVVAVDDQSNYPAQAPVTDLSGITANLEAILSYEPDLVIITFDPGELIAGLGAVGVPTLLLGGAVSIDDVYLQIEVLGSATDNLDAAKELNQSIQADLKDIVAQIGDAGHGVTYYHEIDATLFSLTSSTLFGEIYGLLGMVNIADEADQSGFGYPQLSSEHIVTADPNIIFLANVLYGESAETVAARPGWDVMTAVREGHIAELDSDVASRWGPRIVDFLRDIADAVTEHAIG